MRIKKKIKQQKIISETVEEVEILVVERIANMKIEDQVQALMENIKMDESGNIIIGKIPLTPFTEGGEVQIMDITEITASSTQAALVVDQAGSGGIYGLDLSHSPAEQSAAIGFRCAK